MNTEVNTFLDRLDHPLRKEIDVLRATILAANPLLSENIKWNAPNYSLATKDRITMRIQPPKQIQLIFHRGAKVQAQPEEKLITEVDGLLTWRENDRAIATFKDMKDVKEKSKVLKKVIQQWLLVTT